MADAIPYGHMDIQLVCQIMRASVPPLQELAAENMAGLASN
jgi:hypothetical protein